MATLNEFVEAVNAKLGEIAAGLDNVDGDVTNLQNQIQTLTDLLGQLTPEQQAALDGVLATASAIAEKVGAIDTKTPPVV